MYRYRATTSGVLSSPYRFVNDGELVTSETELKASWLVPADQPIAAPLPLMSHMAASQQPKKHELTDPSGESYKEQMKKIIEREQAEDSRDVLG